MNWEKYKAALISLLIEDCEQTDDAHKCPTEYARILGITEVIVATAEADRETLISWGNYVFCQAECWFNPNNIIRLTRKKTLAELENANYHLLLLDQARAANNPAYKSDPCKNYMAIVAAEEELVEYWRVRGYVAVDENDLTECFKLELIHNWQMEGF